MDIVSVEHKGLQDFIQSNDPKGLKRDQVSRLRNIVAMLITAPNMDGVAGPPGWRIHQLKGDRAGVWSISITRNWRLTFRIEEDAIVNLNLEDYH